MIFSENKEQILFLNATKTAKKFNKKPDDWLRTQQTKDYIKAVNNHFAYLRNVELVVTRKGGKDLSLTGTWIHQKLIIAFARWLSPDFAVWCDLQIEEILKSQTPQTLENLDLDLQISQNRKLLELIELITSQNPKNLFFLNKIYKKLKISSPLDLLEIDLNSFYFIPTELGKFVNKSAVEVNKILESKGFQEKINGVWTLTEIGENYAIQLENNFQTIKWKLESLI